jgi:hypothetical protein
MTLAQVLVSGVILLGGLGIGIPYSWRVWRPFSLWDQSRYYTRQFSKIARRRGSYWFASPYGTIQFVRSYAANHEYGEYEAFEHLRDILSRPGVRVHNSITITLSGLRNSSAIVSRPSNASSSSPA